VCVRVLMRVCGVAGARCPTEWNEMPCLSLMERMAEVGPENVPPYRLPAPALRHHRMPFSIHGEAGS